MCVVSFVFFETFSLFHLISPVWSPIAFGVFYFFYVCRFFCFFRDFFFVSFDISRLKPNSLWSFLFLLCVSFLLFFFETFSLFHLISPVWSPIAFGVFYFFYVCRFFCFFRDFFFVSFDISRLKPNSLWSFLFLLCVAFLLFFSRLFLCFIWYLPFEAQ